MDVYKATYSECRTSRRCAAAVKPQVKPSRGKLTGSGPVTNSSPRLDGCWTESFGMVVYPSPGPVKPILDLMSASCVVFWFSESPKKRKNNHQIIPEEVRNKCARSKSTAMLNFKKIDNSLANIAVNFWNLTWGKETPAIDLKTKLLLSLANGVGAGRYRQATRELVKAYSLGVTQFISHRLCR